MKAAMQTRVEIFQVAVVCKHLVTPPQLTHKRVTVFKRDHALRRFANVRNDILAFDWISPDQFGNRRLTGLLMVDKMPNPHTFKKSNAPTI